MQTFHKILCPVDFSEYSAIALRYAVALAIENEAELVIHHAIPDLVQALHFVEGNYASTVSEALIERSEGRLDEFLSGMIPDRVSMTTRIDTGDAAKSILQAATQVAADLIVMGTHGHSGYERFFIGSITNKVLHKSTTPVLVVCKPSRNFIQSGTDHPVEIRKILCPVDFEPHNRRILSLALAVARTYQSELVLMHVITEQNANDREDKSRRTMEKLVQLVNPQNEDWCKIRFDVRFGNVSDEILSAVGEHEAELVVMGHHTRKPVEELFLGSAAKTVVADCGCPVLVVRSRMDVMHPGEE